MTNNALPKAQKVLIFNHRKKLVLIAASVNDAARYSGQNPGNISKVCNGISISSGMFYYRYIDKTIEIELSDIGNLNLEEYDGMCGVERTVYATSKMNRKKWKYKKSTNNENQSI